MSQAVANQAKYFKTGSDLSEARSSALSAGRLALALMILSVSVFILMVIGGTVRNMGAGLSCPDWPLCHGKLIPPMDPQIFIEWFHRLIASGVSFLLLGISVAVFRNKAYREALGKLNLIAILLLFLQVLLGGLTVIGLLKYEIVTAHLGVGFIFFGTLVLMTLKAHELVPNPKRQALPSEKFSKFAIGGAGVVYLQVLLGGMVASNYAGLACQGFPTCNGEWLPTLSGNVLIQMLHRFGALLVLGKVTMVFVKSLKLEISGRAKKLAAAAFALMLIQVSLGIGSVFMGIPIWMSVAHLGVAAALFASLLMAGYESGRR